MALNGTSEEGTTEGKEEKRPERIRAPAPPLTRYPAALHRIHTPADQLMPQHWTNERPYIQRRATNVGPTKDPRPIVTGRRRRRDNLALSARGERLCESQLPKLKIFSCIYIVCIPMYIYTLRNLVYTKENCILSPLGGVYTGILSIHTKYIQEVF
jgi:hypothetical protein